MYLRRTEFLPLLVLDRREEAASSCGARASLARPQEGLRRRDRLGVAIAVSVALHAAATGALLLIDFSQIGEAPPGETAWSFVIEAAPAPVPVVAAPPEAPEPATVTAPPEPALPEPAAASVAPPPAPQPDAVASQPAKPVRPPADARPPQGARHAAIAGPRPSPARPAATGSVRSGEDRTQSPVAETIVPARPVAGMSANRPPIYPRLAQRRGDEGLVVLRVAVSMNGQPSSVVVLRSSGHDSLDDAATEAVRQWRFVPATRGDVPVAAMADVPVEFRLPH